MRWTLCTRGHGQPAQEAHPHKTLRGSSERSIDKKEYLTAIKKVCGGKCDAWYVMGREAAMEAFSQMDRTNDGEISTWELCRVARSAWPADCGRAREEAGQAERLRNRQQQAPATSAGRCQHPHRASGGRQLATTSSRLLANKALDAARDGAVVRPGRDGVRIKAALHGGQGDQGKAAIRVGDLKPQLEPRVVDDGKAASRSFCRRFGARPRRKSQPGLARPPVEDLIVDDDADAHPASSSQASSTTASQPSSKEASVHPSPRLTPRDAAARADAAVAAIKPWSLITNRDEKVFAKGSVVDEAATGLCAAVAEATATLAVPSTRLAA